MTDFRDRIHAKVHSRFGVDAQYFPNLGSARPVKVKLYQGVAVYGEQLEITGHEDQLVFLSTDISCPEKSESFFIKGTEYQLVKKLEDDGYRQKWIVRHASQ